MMVMMYSSYWKSMEIMCIPKGKFLLKIEMEGTRFC